LREIIGSLQTQPMVGRAADDLLEPHGHFRADATLAPEDLVELLPGDCQSLRSFGYG
jgi:hypothetical protein